MDVVQLWRGQDQFIRWNAADLRASVILMDLLCRLHIAQPETIALHAIDPVSSRNRIRVLGRHIDRVPLMTAPHKQAPDFRMVSRVISDFIVEGGGFVHHDERSIIFGISNPFL